eukprot:7383226-Prymnesium_polylepis.1
MLDGVGSVCVMQQLPQAAAGGARLAQQRSLVLLNLAMPSQGWVSMCPAGHVRVALANPTWLKESAFPFPLPSDR